jgi:hypothetical protein
MEGLWPAFECQGICVSVLTRPQPRRFVPKKCVVPGLVSRSSYLHEVGCPAVIEDMQNLSFLLNSLAFDAHSMNPAN